MRRVLNQAANAVVKAKGTIFEIVYRRTVPRLGHKQTIGAVAHRHCRLIWLILHQGVRYEERGPAVTKRSKQRRTARMIRQLRSLGYRIGLPDRQSDTSAVIFDPGITPFHFHDGVDKLFLRSIRARPTRALGRKQHTILSSPQHAMEMQQSGSQNDGGAENACRAHEKGAQTGDDTIRGVQIGRTLAAAIEDPQLMFDEHRLGNDGTEASWPC